MEKFYSLGFTSDSAYKATLKGDIFQLKLLMAVALRASQTGEQFVLNTEVMEAEKFDDLVVEYPGSATVLQAKHSSKENAKYCKKDFLSDHKGEASLAKYFDSFIRIKEKKLFGEKPVQYIFFTNRFVHEDDFFDCLTSAEEPDKNLMFNKTNSTCWKFNQDFLEQNEEYESIYTELTEAIKGNSFVYYQLLSKELLIDISVYQKTLENDVKKLIVKILDEIKKLYDPDEESEFFINLTGKSGFTKERNLLLSILEHTEEDTGVKFCSAFFKNTGLTNFQQYIKQKLIDGLKQKLNLDDTQAVNILKNVVLQFPKELSTYSWMTKNKQKNAVDIVTDNVNKTLTWTPTKDQAYFLVGMFGEFKFTYQPEKQYPLSDLSIYRGLHRSIIAAIQAAPNANIDEAEAKFIQCLNDFFPIFRIKSGQPNEDQLEQILSKELKIQFQFSGSEYYSQFLTSMLNWMKNIRGKPITRDELKNFFQKITVGVERLHLAGYSQHVIRLLQRYPEFVISKNTLNPLFDFVKNKSKQKSIMLFHSKDSFGLTLTACQLIKKLQNDKVLFNDNWGFIDSECRIIDKVPGVLGQRYQLMIIDHADQLTESELLTNIIDQAVKEEKKLILLCNSEKLSFFKENISEENLVEQVMSNLTDEDIAKMCESHLDKYIFLSGRYLRIGDILATKLGGVYNAMQSISQLAIMLSCAKPAPLNSAASNYSVYIPQQVKTYTAFYPLRDVIQKLPRKNILVIKHTEKIEEKIKNEFSEKTVLNVEKMVKYSKNNPEDLDVMSIFKDCSVEVVSDKKIEKYLKTENLVIISIPNDKYYSDVKKILNYLCENYPVIVVSNKTDFEVENLQAIYANYIGGKLILPLDKRYLFGQPHYELTENSSASAYTQIALLQHQSHHQTTCVTANPGTGKSENFRELIKQWLKQVDLKSTYHWLIVFNLIDIDEQTLKRSLPELLVEYLCRTQKYTVSSEEKQLWQVIIEHDIAHGYVKLLLDGWDEVKGIKENLVHGFIKQLPASIHYDIAMRPYVFASSPCRVYQRIELQPFSKEDLKNYLEKRFRLVSNNPDQNTFPEEKLRLFIEKTLDWLEMADEKTWDVVKIPLLAFLLSESLKADWLVWLDSTGDEPEGPWNDTAELKLVTLYENFILAKARIYLSSHIGVQRNETLNNENQILQLVMHILEAMEEIAFNELFIDPARSCSQITEQTYKAMLDFGIIVGRTEEQLSHRTEYRYQFMQQTFKELFAALHIVKALTYSSQHSEYQVVINVITHARYENTYKVVWRFVRDLIENGCKLLFKKPDIDARTIFTTPEDLIGVASRNLLSLLGLHDGSVKIHDLNPHAVILDKESELQEFSSEKLESVETNEISLNIKQILDELEKNIVNKDKAISLMSKLPDNIPENLSLQFNIVIGKALKSWSYRIYGYAAEKLANAMIQVPVQMLDRLKKIACDSNCYMRERVAAVNAMLKVDENFYENVCDIFFELLEDKQLDIQVKVEILVSIENFLSLEKLRDDEKLKKKIVDVISKGFSYKKESFFYEECLLRELLLIKMYSNESVEFKNHKTSDLAKNFAKKINLKNIKLLLDLLKYKFIKLGNIQSELITGLTEYRNRDAAASMLKYLYDFLLEQKENPRFLVAIFGCNTNKLQSGRLIANSLSLINKNIFEKNRPEGEGYLRFWRLDAGIPIAEFFLTIPVKSYGMAYLIYQIRNNICAYGVANKIINYLDEAIINSSLERYIVLYLSFEFLVLNQKIYSENAYFEEIDSRPGLVAKLVDLAWKHFIEDRRYPLIGLDIIFALGTCYGLPLVQDGDKFKLLLINTTQGVIESPDCNIHQQQVIKKYFLCLRNIVGANFSLGKIIKPAQQERDSLITESVALNKAVSSKSTTLFFASENPVEKSDQKRKRSMSFNL